MHGAELTRSHSHRDVRGMGVVLNPCMGGHHFVTCNGTADLTTEGVQDGAAGGFFDDELDQVHGGIGEASGGFDGQVLGVIHEVAEDKVVPGPFVRLAERKDPA
jgi:hypothetical protein